ncbi:MAG: LamG-like jellyroll fold domain-containing protein [Verrucomicrobiota bacterium]
MPRPQTEGGTGMKKDLDSINQLIDQWLDESIDEAGTRLLNDWIKDSPENADYFAQRSHLHSRLFDWAQSHDSKVVRVRPAVRVRAVLGAAAAIAVIVMGGVWFSKPAPGHPVAELTARADSDLSYQGKLQSLEYNTIRTGSYEAKRGIASFRFHNGVEVVVEAPAEFQIESDLRMSLSQGRLSATVPPEGVGFTVETPSAEVVDFGTEFAVEVAGDRSSEVHVFDGAVDVKPLGNAEVMPVRLITNGATRIEYDSDVPMGIPLAPDRFLRTLEEPALLYSTAVRALSPIVRLRMGLKTLTKRSDVQFVSSGGSHSPLASGKVGASFRFGGPTEKSFVTMPDYAASMTGKLSGVCWVYAESRPRKASIAADTSGPESGQFAWGLWRDKGFSRVKIRQESGDEVFVREREPLPIGEWQQLAFVADGTSVRLYRNGLEVAAEPCGPVASSHQIPLLIGAHPNELPSEAQQFWHGRIDEFAIFDVALTSEQIMALYEIAQAPKY